MSEELTPQYITATEARRRYVQLEAELQQAQVLNASLQSRYEGFREGVRRGMEWTRRELQQAHDHIEALEAIAKTRFDMGDLLRQRDSAVAKVEALEQENERLLARGNYGRAEYNCQRCGGVHAVDTSISSDIWNKITGNNEKWQLLCTRCIDELCIEEGLTVEAKFYYSGGKDGGSGLWSALYDATSAPPGVRKDDYDALAQLTERLAVAHKTIVNLARAALADYHAHQGREERGDEPTGS